MRRARGPEWLSSARSPRHNRRMTRRKLPLLPGFALFVLVFVAAGCASTATVVPGKTLALVEVTYPEMRMSGVVLDTGEATPMTRMAESLLHQFGAEKAYEVKDARGRAHFSSLATDPAAMAAFRQAVPADGYLGVQLLGCSAMPRTETERRGSGPGAVEVTVYFYRGECTAELTALDPEGKKVAVLQKTGRYDSPRQDRQDSSQMGSQALTLAIEDTARRIAREVRPTAGK